MYHNINFIECDLIVHVTHAEPDNTDGTDHTETRLGDDYTTEDSELITYKSNRLAIIVFE